MKHFFLSIFVGLIIISNAFAAINYDETACWVTDSRFAGGAKGDGINDDYLAFAAALKAAESKTQPGEVRVPPGIYKISNTLLVENASVVCSPHAVFKPFSANSEMTMIEMGPTSSWEGGSFCTYESHFTGTIMLLDGSRIFAGIKVSPKINNVSMFSKNVAGGSGTGILIIADGSKKPASGSINRVIFAQFSNIRMTYFTTGIKLYSANGAYVNSNQFNNITIAGCFTGILIQKGTDGLAANGNMFANLAIQPSPESNVGICIDGASYNLFSNLICWDSQNYNTNSLQILNKGQRNNIIGTGYQNTTLDDGFNSMILGVSNKSWSGANN